MKLFIKKIHLWLSLPAGIFITLICMTGAILSFETEIAEMVYSHKYFNDNYIKKRMDLDSLVMGVNKQLMNDTVSGLKIYYQQERNIIASLSSGQRNVAFVNPYTGKIIEKGSSREDFFLQTMLLHRWLMLPNKTTGQILVGISTICMIFILITGIIRWLPKRKTIRQNFFFKWKNAKFNRKNLDLHKILGMYASALLLLMCFTGLMWSFEWYKNGVAKIVGIEIGVQKDKNISPKSNAEQYAFSWQAVFQKTVLQNPDYHFIQITPSGNISLLSQDASHNRATDKYKFNQKDKSVSLVAPYYQQNNSAYLMSQSYVLHAGSWNIFTKILWFIIVLIGASLPVTGYIFWLKRKF